MTTAYKYDFPVSVSAKEASKENVPASVGAPNPAEAERLTAEVAKQVRLLLVSHKVFETENPLVEEAVQYTTGRCS